VASASKKSPRPFIFFLIFSILCFGLIDRGPWRGSDLYGMALIKNCVDSFHGFSSSCIVPNLYGSVIASDGPLFTWIASFLIILFGSLFENITNFEFNLNYMDDLGRVIQSFFVISGLSILWFATKKLAMRRESKPNDPLGIGPTSEKFSSNIADCSVLITISCLGLIMPWHELGKTGLNFMLHAAALYAIVIAPETPKKGGILFGVNASLLLLCSGTGSFTAIYFASLVIFSITYPWTLVKKSFLSHSLISSTIILTPLIFFVLSDESEKLFKVWWQSQLTLDKIQPLFLIKTWLWTWWPLWPIVTAFSIQAYNRGFLSLSHLKMPLILLFCLVLIPLSGVFISDETKFIPVVPLAVLAAFGLLSLPRNIANLIDYFALSIFTFLGIMIWVYWLALHTGTPESIQNNVLRAAPGISGVYSTKELVFGMVATLAWLMLIGWRIRVSEPLLWRPVILSAGGLSMTWILLVNLWGPALEVNRGYGDLIKSINITLDPYSRKQGFCIGINSDDLKSRAIILANSNLRINQSDQKRLFECAFLLIRRTTVLDSNDVLNDKFDKENWKLAWSGSRKADPRKKEIFYLYKKY
jgi:hypothetical protein